MIMLIAMLISCGSTNTIEFNDRNDIEPNIDFISLTLRADSPYMGWFYIKFNDGDHSHASLDHNDLRGFYDTLVDYERTDYTILELEFVEVIGATATPVITRQQVRKLITDIGAIIGK